MRSGRSKTRSATPLPCEQLLGQEPRDDRSRRAISTKCPEPVFRALLDIGGPQGVRFERAATDSHKFGRWQNAPRGRRAQGRVSPEGPSLGRCAFASCWPRAQSGQESALQTLAQQPLGPWLLGAVALGLVAYRLFMLSVARYRH